MSEHLHTSPPRPPFALLLGIVVTLLAMVGHRFLPERRLVIDGTKEGAAFYLIQMYHGPEVDLQWVDQPKFHFTCTVPNEPVYQACGFVYMLAGADVSKGIDLSRYKTLKLGVRYSGGAQYLRVGIRNFDPRFSTVEDLNSPKFNFVNVPTQDLGGPIEIAMSEFAVAEWWSAAYNHPREYTRPDISNATVLNIDLQGELAGTSHGIRLERIEFVGDWISAELWYLGILCLIVVLAVGFGISQWMRLRRKQREQRQKIDDLESEKEEYRRLSTLDGLTNVLNRHGIERFVESLQLTRVAASVIVIDIDHFKRVNDQRGHYGGDRVLRKMGDILRAHTRNTDGLGRWGGEEFVLVCPGTGLEKAAELAEKLRRKVMDTNFLPDNPLPITASFGVAAASADQAFDDAFRQADEALYLAKSRGRNCVVAAGPEEMHNVTGASKGILALVSGRFKLYR